MNPLHSPVGALIWEQVWRNRLVFPALGLLLALGAVLTFSQMPEGSSGPYLRQAAFVAFLISLLLGYVPFALVESQQGWRMNSMVTRWFVLPVRTSLLVAVPFLVACLVLGGLIWGWSPILHRLSGGEFDTLSFLVVLVTGAAAMQALAWIVPRRPTQFWPLAGILFVLTLLFALAAQDATQRQGRNPGMYAPFAILILCFAVVACYAARRNRCGAWPGEFRVGWILELFLGRSYRSRREPTAPAGALFWSDSWSMARAVVLSWAMLALLVMGLFWTQSLVQRPGIPLSFGLFCVAALQTLPIVGLLWLAAAGLFLGTEPGAGFRTRLTSFRATLPVSAGSLAGPRLATALVVWLGIWIPLLALVPFYTPELAGSPNPDATRELLFVITILMAVSAHVLIGAMPLFLWGRLDGFANLLLCGVVSWGSARWLYGITRSDPSGLEPWLGPSIWLGLKLAVCVWALIRAGRAGHITWRFAVGLIVGWMALVTLLTVALPTWEHRGLHGALIIALFIPLARPALCPLALAANRSR
jgi:hypothetical protein